MDLDVSTQEQEGPYEAAKWLKVPVLAGTLEIASLFKRLGPAQLYRLGTPLPARDISLSQEAFLAAIESWNAKLQAGKAVSLADLRSTLACAMTLESNCLWLQQLEDGRCLAKIRRPVVQIQAHFFSFAPEEKAFYSMVLGKGSIFWGIQFSYPQIFMDPKDSEPKKVDASFANSALFSEIRRWSRDETKATPFRFGQEKLNAPIRLGKSCFSWIASHPQLEEHQLEVDGAG